MKKLAMLITFALSVMILSSCCNTAQSSCESNGGCCGAEAIGNWY